jgi:hypothetical protein
LTEATPPGEATTPASGVPTTAPAAPKPAGPSWPTRIFATLAVGAVVGTFVAVQIDQVRRHFPGVDPAKYWLPQLQQVTLPGLGAGLLCGLIAFAFHRLGRRA